MSDDKVTPGQYYDLVRRRLWEEGRYATPEGWRLDCPVCGRALARKDISMDRHPVPGSQGGTYAYGNVRLTCRQCNTDCGSHGHHSTVRAGMSKKERHTYNRALRRTKELQLLPKDVFGPNWKPGTFL